MLIGAHVSSSGGLPKAVERGVERGCTSIQIFHQSPRMWKPTVHTDEDFAAFREAMEASPVDAVIIHAVYLINVATTDSELRKKSLGSLTHALEVGAGIGADGVILHPGAQKGEPHGPSMKRAAKVIAEAVKRTEGCDLLLEQTAGHEGLLGKNFDEIASLIELAGGGERLGLCLDTCHLYAMGYDITTAENLGVILDEADEKVGLDRLRALHINDSKVPLGAMRDRHENVGKGEIGKRLSVFLSEPRFDGLPATLETPGPDKKGSDKAEVSTAKRLRKAGLKARAS